VPLLQGLEFFALLAERGKTVRMVTYPGSPHFPSLWEQRKNIFEEIGAWQRLVYKFITFLKHNSLSPQLQKLAQLGELIKKSNSAPE
jgi:dipeptidyl aminopeptidase/acylaminoacyl peptidase